MEFYIWNQGGAADEVLKAVIRAAGRGVQCRLLVDALGARPWWKGGQPQRLREAGVELRAALPVGLLRTVIGRTDLRLHRKIVVIDGAAAWTGSMNLVDPRYFKQDSGVGEWVDAMVRFEGTVVNPLAATLLGDWILETGETMQQLIDSADLGGAKPVGSANVQVVPIGAGRDGGWATADAAGTDQRRPARVGADDAVPGARRFDDLGAARRRPAAACR